MAYPPPDGRAAPNSTSSKMPRATTINRALLIAGSVAIIVLLSLAVIVVALVGPGGGKNTAIVTLPTDPPTATITPTPTLPTIATPQIGQFQTDDGSQCLPQQLEAYVYDPQTGRVLLTHNADHPQPMASTTKIMTAFVAITYGGDLSQKITVTHAMYDNEIAPLIIESATVMGVQPGDVYTLRDLLYGLLLPSGDDAAIVIADGMFGSQAAFVARMNEMAAWLQLSHTHYVNTHGLFGDGQVSSAADLAKLAQVARYQSAFRQITATPIYTIPANNTHQALKLYNTNILLTDGKNLGVDGVKTGFTGCNYGTGAGECVVLHAQLGGHELFVVVMGDGGGNERFIDGAALLAWGFREEGMASAKVPPISLTPTVHP